MAKEANYSYSSDARNPEETRGPKWGNPGRLPINLALPEPPNIAHYSFIEALFTATIPTLAQWGITEDDLTEYTQAIARGDIPRGLGSLAAFNHYLSKLHQDRNKE